MNLLKQLLHRGCTHRFSWPRVSTSGNHYQICLSCGVAYEYDWQRMRRSKKILTSAIQHAEILTQNYLRYPSGLTSK
jgi:hypothetical protein